MEHLKDGGDPLVFFAAIEKLFAVRGVLPNQQVGHLVELLGTKALDAFSKMSLEDSRVYDRVRATILQRFQISPEIVREKFRSATLEPSEAYSEFAIKLTGWATAWLQDPNGGLLGAKEILDVILLEQFLGCIPDDLRTWLLDKKVKIIKEAADLADGYVQVRRMSKVTVGDTCNMGGTAQVTSTNSTVPVASSVPNKQPQQRGLWNAGQFRPRSWHGSNSWVPPRGGQFQQRPPWQPTNRWRQPGGSYNQSPRFGAQYNNNYSNPSRYSSNVQAKSLEQHDVDHGERSTDNTKN